MSNPLYFPAWQRPHWQPSDEEIIVQFYVFGDFQPIRVPSEPYGSDGLPEEVELTSHHHSALREWEGYPLKGSLGELFKDDAPEAFEKAIAAPQVLVLRGRFKDSADTGYLRDTLGVIAGLLDMGGVAVLDPQILTLFSADEWRKRYLIKDGAPLRHHVLILRDEEGDSDRLWIHTRGLRKFGRPDISLHDVPAQELDRAGALCQRLVELQALGAHFKQGQALEVDGILGGLTAELGGGYSDPQFNNTYVAFYWPSEQA
ncbi:hypothetical protein [Dyella caseinilytica]|uniref:Uncharacterized protein n=1 Tax=Dyella caseinilytica TaxID=1849581 RepID=A0ABX7GUN7_9GAMM|nr:hypothetical protein [Dyella caseinilytica]QRN54014.1 hypothetical protein ISN74_00980 [Dyella caseinilytica]GFZ90893.1 hypothetical protein GCM10011408_07660 [Dyella caseinilytica]